MLLSTQFELEKSVYGKKQTYIFHICTSTYLSTYLSIYLSMERVLLGLEL